MLKEQHQETRRPLTNCRKAAARNRTPTPTRSRIVVTSQLGQVIGGWKVGAASSTALAFCAPIYTSMIRPSPASYEATELRLIGIEAEIAFRLGPRSAAACRDL